MELPASGGLLPGVCPENSEGNQVSRGFHGGRGGVGLVVGGEGGGVASVGGHQLRVDRQAPADRLSRPIEVPLEGMVFCAAHQPRHRDNVPDH